MPLPPHLEQQRREFRDQWWKIARSTSAPCHAGSPSEEPTADTEAVAHAMEDIYQVSDLPPHPKIIWQPSPQAGLDAVKNHLSEHPKDRPVFDLIHRRVDQHAQKWIKDAIGLPEFLRHRHFFESRESLLPQVRTAIHRMLPHDEKLCGYGTLAGDTMGAYDFCFSAYGLLYTPGIQSLLALTKAANWWWPFEKCCILTQKPKVFEKRGAAPPFPPLDFIIEYRDGWGVAAAEREVLSFGVLKGNESLSAHQIDRIRNVEFRRFLIERYGMEKYLYDTGAVVVHQDDFGTLYLKETSEDEPLVMVKVLNATPEPDGTFKDYFLRVPPEVETAREAVAWTFGYDNPEDYVPNIES